MYFELSPEIELFMIAVTIAIAFGILGHFIRRKTVGKDALKKLKEKGKEARELMKKTDRASQERLNQLNIEIVEMNLSMMKASLPIMFISIGSFLFLWPILSNRYSGHSFPVVNSWVWYYVIVSMMASLLLQLLLKRFED
ncbi:MAG: EMC3/TMCO1 family protein [Candidatus Diapherotrites archaeon]|nr:EMC3/TMCO1 family protein [Candidatus Diapherotrites archaeon]